MTHQNTKWFLIAIALQCVVALALKEIYPHIAYPVGEPQPAQSSAEVQTQATTPVAPIEATAPMATVTEPPPTRSAMPANLGVTNLMRAAGDGNCDEIASLVKSGEDVDARNKNGTDALIYAASAGHKDCVSALLKAGAKTSTVDKSGDSALSSAKQQGFSEIVSILETATR
jgi:hypothetical protein